MNKKIKPKAGETLVEVVASIFIFLIMIGILQGAISYSSASMKKNKEIRKENAEILQNLQTAETTVGNSQSLQFVAVNSGMTTKGNPVFRIEVSLCSKLVNYQDTEGYAQSTTFYLYGAPQGGDTP